MIVAPGPLLITPMRSASVTASMMSCVMNSTDVPVDSQMRSSSACIVRRVCASSDANGSSISRIFGPIASARAICTRCFMPPDNSSGNLSSCSVRPTSFSSESTRLLALVLRTVEHLQPELDVLAHRHPREERVVDILEHDDPVVAGPGQRLAVEPDPAFGRRQESGDDVEQRALAATALADEAEKLAFADPDVDVAQHIVPAGTGLEPVPADIDVQPRQLADVTVDRVHHQVVV